MTVMDRAIAEREARKGPAAGQTIDVAACIVRDSNGRVLMAERRAEQLSGGFWEIPGGKIEPGESAVAAAARELMEETGLVAQNLRPVTSYVHRFPTRRINLTLFEAMSWSGTPTGRENQRVEWVDPVNPQVAPILPSNRKALQVLSLPSQVLCAAAPCCNTPAWARATVDQALALGAGAILFTDANLIPVQRATLARALANQSTRYDLPIWVQDAASSAAQMEEALHIVSNRSLLPTTRGSGTIYGLIEADADRLSKELTTQADFFIVPLPNEGEGTRGEWQAFRNLTETVSTPVYAMISADRATQAAAYAAGATGICIQAD